MYEMTSNPIVLMEKDELVHSKEGLDRTMQISSAVIVDG